MEEQNAKIAVAGLIDSLETRKPTRSFVGIDEMIDFSLLRRVMYRVKDWLFPIFLCVAIFIVLCIISLCFLTFEM